MNRLVFAIGVVMMLLLAGCIDPNGLGGCTASNTCEHIENSSVPPTTESVDSVRAKAETLLKQAGFARETPVRQYPATWKKDDDTVQITQDLVDSLIIAKFTEGTLQCRLIATAAVPDAPAQIADIRQEGYAAAQNHHAWDCTPV